MTDRKSRFDITPHLPFGSETAFISQDLQAFTDQVSSAIEGLRQYDALKEEFCYVSSQLNVNNLHMIASSSTPVSYSVVGENLARLYAVLPRRGFADAKVPGDHRKWYVDEGVFLSPEIERSGSTSEIAMTQLNMDTASLLDTVKAMFGESIHRSVKERLRDPIVLPYRTGGVRYDHMFSGIYRLIDELRSNEISLTRIGVDDQIYRVIAMMLATLSGDDPASVPFQNNPGRMRARSSHRACEYMRANYEKTVTLTMLEHISGLSARSLQLAFKREWGCSPLEWLKNLRLDVAHQRLRCPKEGDNVTKIALDSGFTRIANFSQIYAQRFGELPSVTLVRGR